MVLDVIHPARPNVSRAELCEKLAAMYKAPKEQCVVFGMRTAFGGGRSTGFALVYDSRESMKFEPKFRLVRVSIMSTHATSHIVSNSYSLFVNRLASLPRPKRHRESCAKNARTEPRRSVVSRRPRPATRRRSKHIHTSNITHTHTHILLYSLPAPTHISTVCSYHLLSMNTLREELRQLNPHVRSSFEQSLLGRSCYVGRLS